MEEEKLPSTDNDDLEGSTPSGENDKPRRMSVIDSDTGLHRKLNARHFFMIW